MPPPPARLLRRLSTEIEHCQLIQKPLVVSVKVVFTLTENKDENSLCATSPPRLPSSLSPVLFEGRGWLYTGYRFSAHYVI